VPDSLTFADDVVQTICERFQSKAADLQLLIETDSSFEEWLKWEAFLACKQRQASYPFCEVVAKPTYASEGIENDNTSDLRVGGPDEGANHCWAFLELVLFNCANDSSEETSRKLKATIERLKQLGWKKSAALLIVVTVNLDNALEGVVESESEVWNRPTLTEPCVFQLPIRGLVVVKAFDIKQNPTDTLLRSEA
jgi:hypothetical protein